MTRVDTVTSGNQNLILPFEEQLKPVLFSMKMFGLYYEKQYPHATGTAAHVHGTDLNSLPNRNRYSAKDMIRKVANSRTYSFVILVILIISGIRYFPSFWIGPSFDSGIVLEVITMAFSVQCLVNRLVLFISFGKDNRFMELKNHFNNRVATSLNGNVKFQTRIKMSIVCFTCLAWIVFAFEIIGSFIMIISDVIMAYVVAVCSPLPESVPARIISCLITFYGIATWSLTTCHIMCVSCIIYYKFDEVNHALEKSLKDEGITTITHIEKYRVCHERLCEAVGLADLDFKYLVANNYVTNMFMSCFIIYNLISNPSTTFYFLILEISWIIFNLLSVLLVSWVAALVNESVSIVKLVVLFHFLILEIFLIILSVYLLSWVTALINECL